MKEYNKGILKFIEWCNLSNVRPVRPFPVSLAVAYLRKVYKSSNSYAALVVADAALKWFHFFIPSNGSNPLNSSICHNLLEAAKRCKPVTVKKAPISADIIRSIIDKYASPSANLKDLRVACICSLGFAGCFRYDELSSIVSAHLEFFPDYLKVFVPRAKNDVYRDRNYVYIKRLGNKYCPMADVNFSSNVALFRSVRPFKSCNTYKLCGGKLSYTRCREIFKDCLKNLAQIIGCTAFTV